MCHIIILSNINKIGYNKTYIFYGDHDGSRLKTEL